MMHGMSRFYDCPDRCPLASGQASGSQAGPRQFNIGKPPDARRQSGDDEEARTRVVQFPMEVHLEHMKQVFATMKENTAWRTYA